MLAVKRTDNFRLKVGKIEIRFVIISQKSHKTFFCKSLTFWCFNFENKRLSWRKIRFGWQFSMFRNSNYKASLKNIFALINIFVTVFEASCLLKLSKIPWTALIMYVSHLSFSAHPIWQKGGQNSSTKSSSWNNIWWGNNLQVANYFTALPFVIWPFQHSFHLTPSQQTTTTNG